MICAGLIDSARVWTLGAIRSLERDELDDALIRMRAAAAALEEAARRCEYRRCATRIEVTS